LDLWLLSSGGLSTAPLDRCLLIGVTDPNAPSRLIGLHGVSLVESVVAFASASADHCGPSATSW
jgi:hypothetical protein